MFSHLFSGWRQVHTDSDPVAKVDKACPSCYQPVHIVEKEEQEGEEGEEGGQNEL